jgi:hypothetical protein
MTYATRSSLHVGISKPRNSLSNPIRIVLKALTRGLVAAVIVVMTVAAVMTGAGWLLAVSLEARADIRSVVAPPSARLAWTGPFAAGSASRLVAASGSPPAPEPAFELPVLNPIGALALVIADSSDTSDHTGSIGSSSAVRASLNVASGSRHSMPSILGDAHLLPLPRARPRLAALSPAQQLGTKLEEDSRSLRTAIYDITAQVVYLPNGERLEAHSGLGHLMDDPRHVRQKNRGATPPNTYELKLRESLFHGVQAIRMTPVGDGEMFNRDGILAHSYMLGPSGQSNGCVSFKDYPRFLRAYLRGEINRIVVVSRLDTPPTFVTRSNVRNVANAL